MKKWSVLSIPAIGLAGLGIWAQSLVAAPTNQPTGVVVVDPAASSKVSSSSAPAPAPAASAPNGFRSAEAPRRLDMVQPQTTEQAEAQDAGDDGPGVVQHVEPTQVTSPAAPPPAGTASATADDKAGPDDSAPKFSEEGVNDAHELP